MADNNYVNWEAYTNSRFKPLPFKDQSESMGFFVRPIIGLTAREETDPIVPAGGTQEQARFMPPLSLPKEDDLQVDNPNVNPNFQPAQQTQQVQQAQTVAPQQLTPPAPAQPIADNNYTQAEIQNMKLYGMPRPPAVVTHPTVGMPVQQYTPNAVTYQIPDTTQDAYKQVMDNYYTQLNDAIPQQRAYWQKAHNFANSELDRQALIRQREEEQYQEAKARSERAYAKEKEGDGSSWWNPAGILTGLGEVFYGSRKYNPQTRQYELTAPTSWKEATQNIVRNIATAGSGLSFGYGKGGLRTAYNAAMPEFYRAKREQNQRAPHVAWEAAQDQLLAQSIDPHPRQPLRPWTFDTPLPTVDHPFTNFMVDVAQKEAARKSAVAQADWERELFHLTPEQYNKRLRELTGQPQDIQEVIDEYEKYADANNVPEKERRKVRRELEYAKLGLNAPAEEKNIQEVIDERREELAATMKLLADAGIPEADRGKIALQIVLGGGIGGSTGRGKGVIDFDTLTNGGWTVERVKQKAPEILLEAQAIIDGDATLEEVQSAIDTIDGFESGIANLKLGEKDYDRAAMAKAKKDLEGKKAALKKAAEKTEKGTKPDLIKSLGVLQTTDAKKERQRKLDEYLSKAGKEERPLRGFRLNRPRSRTAESAPWWDDIKTGVVDTGRGLMHGVAMTFQPTVRPVGALVEAASADGRPGEFFSQPLEASRSPYDRINYLKKTFDDNPNNRTVRGQVILPYADDIITAAESEAGSSGIPTRQTFIKSGLKLLRDVLSPEAQKIVFDDKGVWGEFLGVAPTNADIINEWILNELYNKTYGYGDKPHPREVRP